jgi:hypothetical protein
MTIHNIQLRLQLSGQQATQQMQRLNLQQSQAQQQQKQNLNQILQTQNRLNASVQQGGRYGQQQMRTGQSMVQTNRLLAQILQQQQRSSSLIGQQLQQQQRSYQMQLNTLRSQVREAERLRQQLQQAGQAQRDNQRNGIGGGSNLMGNTAAVVGGAYAASSIGANYLKGPRAYMESISRSTGTIYAGQKQTVEQRKEKVMETEHWVRNSAVSGGSGPEAMAAVLAELSASPAFKPEELKGALLEISKTAFASGSNPVDIAKMVIANRQHNPGMSVEKATNMAFRSGQLGSFELSNMARSMPSLQSTAKGAGYTGEEGYRNLLTMAQVSTRTASTPDQAANNLENLLGEFSQHHFGLQIAKYITPQKGLPIAKYGVAGKRTGVDWTKYAADAQARGVGQVDAAAELLNGEMQTNPLYRKYQAKAQNAQKDILSKQKLGLDVTKDLIQYQQNLDAALKIVGQSEVGKIFHNKQSLAAFTAVTLSKGKGGDFDELMQQTDYSNSQTAIADEHKLQSAEEYAKDGSFETARFNAETDNYNGVAGWLGDLKQGLADFASSNAGVAAAASLAVAGLTAVGAAGGIAALTMRRGQPPIPPVGGGLGGKVGTVSLAAGQVALSGALGYAIGTEIRDMYMQTETGQKFDDYMGEKIAQTLALFGNDEAQAALDNNAKYEQMIAQQEQANKLSSDLSNKLSTLITATQNNKPIPFNTGSLLDGISNHAKAESNRHGAPPAYMLVGK